MCRASRLPLSSMHLRPSTPSLHPMKQLPDSSPRGQYRHQCSAGNFLRRMNMTTATLRMIRSTQTIWARSNARRPHPDCGAPRRTSQHRRLVAASRQAAGARPEDRQTRLLVLEDDHQVEAAAKRLRAVAGQRFHGYRRFDGRADRYGGFNRLVHRWGLKLHDRPLSWFVALPIS